tara:strand:+ start:1102 stop:2112 length:1011 start_codon:yes stop_codon:yes gene_type:complete
MSIKLFFVLNVNLSVIKVDKIKKAHDRIMPYIHRTPVLRNGSLNKLCSAELYFKCENFQKAGSFKIRGATNAVMLLDDNCIKHGVVTVSSGNHGAALAMAVQLRDGTTNVIMPKNTPKIKVENVARYSGKIIWCEATLQSREKTLKKVIRESGLTLVHPYNDINVISGQGTVAKEFLEEIPELDIIVCPVSGGGLLSGTLIFSKEMSSKICVYGAEPEKANDAYRSLQKGTIQSNKKTNTICDGLRAQIGELCFPIIKEHVDEIITVSEKEIVKSMLMIWERMKIIVEPSCAITLAAILKRKEEIRGKKVGLILSGGNVDLTQLPWMISDFNLETL